jgi:hypothetical protein
MLLADLQNAFAACSCQVKPLHADNFLGWSRVPRVLRPALPLFRWYVRWSSRPDRVAVYSSPFNSFFLVLVVR